MFKAIGTIIILYWLASHFTATFSAIDKAGAAVFTAVAKVASNTPATLVIPAPVIPGYTITGH